MESLRINLGKSTISDVFGAVRLDQKNQVQSGIGKNPMRFECSNVGNWNVFNTVQYCGHLEFLCYDLGKCNVSGTVSLHERAGSQQPNKRNYFNLRFFSDNVFQMPIKIDTWSF